MDATLEEKEQDKGTLDDKLMNIADIQEIITEAIHMESQIVDIDNINHNQEEDKGYKVMDFDKIEMKSMASSR